MESCVNYIRVRLDLRDVGLPFVKQAWVSVDRSVQRTITDFKLSLYRKFKLVGNRNISLYLQGCLLPDEESIFLLRDGDVISVVYENLPSLLDSQCNDFMGFASSSRDSVRHITDGRYDVSFPPAKKARVLPPVCITESLYDTSDAQNSLSEGTYLTDISTKINTNIRKTESVKKKHKKQKKHLKEKNRSNSAENLLHLENGLNNGATEAQDNGVLPNDKLGSLIKRTQDHQGENCVSEMTSPKEQKEKQRKHSSKNAAVSSKEINETSSAFENSTDCTDAKKGTDVVLSKNSAQSNGHTNRSTPEKTLSKKHKASDVISDEFENHMDVQKLGGKSSDVSNVELQYATEVVDDVRGSRVSPKTECGNSVRNLTSSCEVSKTALSPVLHTEENTTFLHSLHDKPMQKENNCTQSLGNNCPKKKKRVRRGKRKSTRLAVPIDNMNSNCSGNLLPSSTCSIGESVDDFSHDVKSEHNGRKHIRFVDYPERNCVATVLDNDHSETGIVKDVSAVMEATHSSQKLFKMGVSTSCGDAKEVIPGTSFHQEELVASAVQSNCAERTKNETNVQGTSESALKENKNKSYEGFPPLNKFPVVGDIIAFKMLELTDSYCPEVSNYKEGRVVNINSSTDVLEIDLVEEQVLSVRTGKFENVYPGEELEPHIIKKVLVQWSALIEPKLIS